MLNRRCWVYFQWKKSKSPKLKLCILKKQTRQCLFSVGLFISTVIFHKFFFSNLREHNKIYSWTKKNAPTWKKWSGKNGILYLQIILGKCLSSLLDVLAHELSVEIASERIVDEGLLLLVGLCPGAVLEDDVVVPAALDLHVRLVGGRWRSIFLAQERIARQNVLHPTKTIFISYKLISPLLEI